MFGLHTAAHERLCFLFLDRMRQGMRVSLCFWIARSGAWAFVFLFFGLHAPGHEGLCSKNLRLRAEGMGVYDSCTQYLDCTRWALGFMVLDCAHRGMSVYVSGMSVYVSCFGIPCVRT